MGKKDFKSFEPAQIPGLKNIHEVVGGWQSFMALDNDGHVWVWGNNERMQLGKLDIKYIPSPTIHQFLENIVDLSFKGSHGLALDKSGNVIGCFG